MSIKTVIKSNRFLCLVLAVVLAVGIIGTVPAVKIDKVTAATPKATLLPYQDKENYTFEERAADLVSRLTLEEKISQTLYVSPKIERDGIYINDYSWSNEGVHGVGFWPYDNATSFPTALGMAASWDPDMMKNIGSVISDEARAMYYKSYKRLTYWSPTVNLARDPRWGRNEESYGEDPYLTAIIGSAYVNGMQGDDDTYLKTVATLKHFLANNSEYNRHTGDSVIDEDALYNYYTLPYRNIIRDANVYSVMTSYNRVNGVPMSANTSMIDKLRNTWGLLGYIVSDCGAVNDIWKNHNWNKFGTTGLVDSVAASITAGTDLDCGSNEYNSIKDAINAGYMTEEDLDKAVYRLILARMKLGEWDEPRDGSGDKTPYYMSSETAKAELDSAEHAALALKSGEQSITLLENKNDVLPIPLNSNKSVALVGALANQVILGDYSGTPADKNMITPVAGLNNVISQNQSSVNVTYYQNSNDSRPYLFNFQKLELINENGAVINTLHADNATEYGGNIVKESGNFGCIQSGSWIKFPSVALSGAVKVRAYIAINNDAGKGGVIDVRLGSTSGNLVSKLTTPSTGSSWSDYKAVEGEYDYNVGYQATADVYINFSAASVSGTLNSATLSEIGAKDYAIVYVGMDGDSVKEDFDRENLELPNGQVDLIKSVAAVNSNTIVFIQANGCVNISAFKDLANVKAILYTPHNGQAQGQAFANVIFGIANPGGKLPFTWINNTNQISAIGDYDLYSGGADSGRTYMYYTGAYQYPFGYGLSYTDFEVSDCTIDKTAADVNGSVTLSAKVKNIGAVEGSTVVQLYVKTPDSTMAHAPIKRLAGSKKVYLKAGESQNISITVNIKDVALWDSASDRYTVQNGRYVFDLGFSSKDSDVFYTKTVNVTGVWNETLQNVKLDAPTIKIKSASPVALSLSVSADNDRMVNNGYTVKYTSSNEKVLVVDKNGNVSAGRQTGVALITATVTYGNVTKSSSVAIASEYANALVGVSPAAVSFDGREFSTFSESVSSYDIFVAGKKAPDIGVKTRDGISVTVNQNDYSLPSTATVRAYDPSEDYEKIYTFNFYPDSERLKSDFFTTATLNSDVWTVVRPGTGSEAYSYSAGNGVTIPTTQSDISGSANNAKNLILQKVRGNFSAETLIQFSSIPSQEYQQAGFVVRKDDDNFVKLTVEPSGEYNIIKLQKEDNGTTSSDVAFATISKSDYSSNRIYLRIAKNGTVYTAYYSLNGTTFNTIGSVSSGITDVSLGLCAVHVVSAASINATFKYVRSLNNYNVFAADNYIHSDYFTGKTLSDCWTVENADGYTYTAGKGITIPTTATDLSNTCKNFFTQAVDGDFEVETSAQFSAMPNAEYQQAGLTVYQDNKNFIKLSLEPTGNTQFFKFQIKQNGTTDDSKTVFAYIEASRVANNTVYFRLAKRGDQYIGYYSYDGKEFIELSRITVGFGNVKLGLFAVNVVNAPSINVTFGYLKSLSDPEALPTVDYKRGDCWPDGNITASDALAALKESVGVYIGSNRNLYAADVDRNGIVTASDALSILQYSVELIDKF